MKLVKKLQKLQPLQQKRKLGGFSIEQGTQIQKSISLLVHCVGELTELLKGYGSSTSQNLSFQDKQKYSLASSRGEPKFNVNRNITEDNLQNYQSLNLIDKKQKKENNYVDHSFQQMEHRFRDVNIDLPNIGDTNKENLSKELLSWIGKACKRIFSVGFSLLERGILPQNKVKAFCSQNMLRNLIRFSQKYELSAQHFELINVKLQKEILPYFLTKYPQTEEKYTSKRFSDTLIERDDTAENDLDLVYKSGVDFEYSENGDYNSQIMQFLNFIIKLPTQVTRTQGQESQNKEQGNKKQNRTMFQFFNTEMQKIFRLVESEKQKIKILKFDQRKPEIYEIQTEVKRQQIVKELIQQREKSEQQYRQKVKSYTNYQIGSKLSPNLNLFSKFEINAGNLTLSNSAIMRIITKWCEQLQQCYDANKIIERSAPFRMKDGSLNYLNQYHKKMLSMMLQKEKRKIDQKLKQIYQNNYLHQSNLSKKNIDSSLQMFSEQQSLVGQFISLMFKINENYLINYLNLLIHGINQASINYAKLIQHENASLDLQQQNFVKFNLIQDKFSQELFQQALQHISLNPQFYPKKVLSETPQLINFKIGDLMRCKCLSRETQILAIYKEIQRINHFNPGLLRILRIKNRLSLGNKDILMNLMFKERIVVQIQLAIKSDKSKFIECSNSFNHYLYELKRAKFGPLAEMCSIWSSQDSRSPFFIQKIKQISKGKIAKDINFQQKLYQCCSQPANLEILKFPFACGICSAFYLDCTFTQAHVICKVCNKKICFNCQVQYFNMDANLIQKLNLDLQLNAQEVKFEKTIPQKGGVIINLRSKYKNITYFNSVKYKNEYYMFETPNKKVKNDAEFLKLNLIYKSKTKKFSQSFLKQNLIITNSELKKKILRLSVDQAQFSVFIPEYLEKLQKTQKKSAFLNAKLMPHNYFKNKIIAEKNMENKMNCWSFIQRLSISESELENLEQVLPELFPNIRSLILNQNALKDFSSCRSITNWNSLKELYLSNNRITNLKNIVILFQNLQIFDVSTNKITQLPKELGNLKNLRSFNVMDNKVMFYDQQFSNLEQLQNLNMMKNQFKKIQENFCKLKSLKKLNLQRNGFQQLPKDFGNLNNIIQLSLAQTQIVSLPQSFGKLKSLVRLSVQKSTLQFLPDSFGQLTNLVYFNCQASKICKFPDSFVNLDSLKQIRAHKTKIQYLPEEFGKLKQLTRIDLGFTPLITIPQSFGKLLKLQQLLLNGAQIQRFPESFSDLRFIKIIAIERGKLVELPNSFGKLKSLQKLNLKKCPISILPQSFSQLRSLKFLNLSETKIENLPENFGFLKSLQDFRIDISQLKNLPESFGNLHHLKLFRMDQNIHITQLPKSFGNLKFLQYLMISENSKLTSLPESFGNLQSLKIFQAKQANLSCLPQSFGQLRSLEQLDIEKSRIEFLPQSFRKLKSLQCLNIQGTKLTQLPEGFGQLESLIKLNLQLTQICKLPLSFGPLKSLVQLRLCRKIQSLPDSFGQLLSLKQLYMRQSHIKFLPYSFGRLSSLTKIQFDYSHIISLPDSFGDLKNLKQLNLRKSALEELPQTFGKLKSLTDLILEGTKIEFLPASFGLLDKLYDLNLGFTKIKNLPQNFCNLISLKKLFLNETLIEQLPQQIGLLHLHILNIESTKITKLPDSICRLRKLSKLVLNKLAIIQLPINFGELQNLTTLQLNQSKIRCLPKSITKCKELIQISLRSCFQLQPQSLSILKDIKNTLYLDVYIENLDKHYIPLEKMQQIKYLLIQYNQINEQIQKQIFNAKKNVVFIKIPGSKQSRQDKKL